MPAERIGRARSLRVHSARSVPLDRLQETAYIPPVDGRKEDPVRPGGSHAPPLPTTRPALLWLRGGGGLPGALRARAVVAGDGGGGAGVGARRGPERGRALGPGDEPPAYPARGGAAGRWARRLPRGAWQPDRPRVHA